MMINDESINRILRKADLAQCTVSGIGAGHYNDSYYIDSEKGTFVLRIAPPDSVPKLFYEIDMMKSEVDIHKIVREKTDLPVPKIIYYDFSKEIIDADYLIMEFLPGSPGAFDQKQLGEYVKQLHTIKGSFYGYPDRTAHTAKNWPDIFYTYVNLIFKDCLSCGIIDDNDYTHFISIYQKHCQTVEQVPPCLLHLDLWTQNILTVNGQITAILDFDRGLYGDPELEFAVLDTYGYSSAEFFDGYGKPRPTDSKAQIRQRLYIVYELIKYAFIRTARGRSFATGRSHVAQCKRILQEIE
ncbi:MAG: fructosamine kinase family protein [Planctomycetota bacterium]|jgi:fructosamine-3-kinase